MSSVGPDYASEPTPRQLRRHICAVRLNIILHTALLAMATAAGWEHLDRAWTTPSAINCTIAAYSVGGALYAQVALTILNRALQAMQELDHQQREAAAQKTA